LVFGEKVKGDTGMCSVIFLGEGGGRTRSNNREGEREREKGREKERKIKCG
jgi:hypothetical protein